MLWPSNLKWNSLKLVAFGLFENNTISVHEHGVVFDPNLFGIDEETADEGKGHQGDECDTADQVDGVDGVGIADVVVEQTMDKKLGKNHAGEKQEQKKENHRFDDGGDEAETENLRLPSLLGLCGTFELGFHFGIPPKFFSLKCAKSFT